MGWEASVDEWRRCVSGRVYLLLLTQLSVSRIRHSPAYTARTRNLTFLRTLLIFPQSIFPVISATLSLSVNNLNAPSSIIDHPLVAYSRDLVNFYRTANARETDVDDY